jgi:uncharacterized protein (TIRG00374 family)
LIKLAISAALLAIVGVLNRESFAETLAYQPSPGRLAAALCWYLAGVMLAFARWWLLVRAVELPFSLREAFRLGWIGMFFNLVIPGAVGGDVVKAAYLMRDQDRKSRAVASIVIDRLVGLLGLFLLAGIAGMVAARAGLARELRPIVVSAWVAYAVTLGLLVLAFTIRPDGPISRRLKGRRRARRLFEELHATGVAYRRRIGWVIAAHAMAALTHLSNVAAFYEVSRALFPVREIPDFLGHLLLVPLILFSTAIPLPFSGLGAAENVSALLFRTLDYGGGAVAMLGFRLLQLGAAIIGAGVYLTYRRKARERPEPLEALPAGPHATSETLRAPL